LFATADLILASTVILQRMVVSPQRSAVGAD
jgi:hypothetical protein